MVENSFGFPAQMGFDGFAIRVVIAVCAVVIIFFMNTLLSEDASDIRSASRPSVTAELNTLDGGPFYPLVAPRNLDPNKVALGRDLFHDPRLSGDGTVSCASCHNILKGGDDGLSYSIGVSGKPTAVNSPSVLNSGLQFRLFWDGRAATLEDQIDGPLHHPDEMDSNWKTVLDRLALIPGYAERFPPIYGGAATEQSVKDALATFERSLVTTNSSFDRYLMGDEEAMSSEARAGLGLFSALGCASCHQGRLIGGNLYQKVGIYHDFFASRQGPTKADLGRYNVTGREEDRYYFKVPSLREVAETAPYFHDGSAGTLSEAVETMAFHQLGRILSDEETGLIVAFLESLTGDLPNAIGSGLDKNKTVSAQ